MTRWILALALLALIAGCGEPRHNVTLYKVRVDAFCDGTAVGTTDNGFNSWCAPTGTGAELIVRECESYRPAPGLCGSYSITCTVEGEYGGGGFACSCATAEKPICEGS